MSPRERRFECGDLAWSVSSLCPIPKESTCSATPGSANTSPSKNEELPLLDIVTEERGEAGDGGIELPSKHDGDVVYDRYESHEESGDCSSPGCGTNNFPMSRLSPYVAPELAIEASSGGKHSRYLESSSDKATI